MKLKDAYSKNELDQAKELLGWATFCAVVGVLAIWLVASIVIDWYAWMNEFHYWDELRNWVLGILAGLITLFLLRAVGIRIALWWVRKHPDSGPNAPAEPPQALLRQAREDPQNITYAVTITDVNDGGVLTRAQARIGDLTIHDYGASYLSSGDTLNIGQVTFHD